MSLSFEILLNKYLQDALDPEETLLFLELARKEENREILSEALDRQLQRKTLHQASKASDLEQQFQQMLAKAEQQKKTIVPSSHKPVFKIYKLAAAAAVLLIIAGVFYYLRSANYAAKNNKEQVANKPKDASPGGNKAILTLADGSEIVLDEAANGMLVNQQNVRVVKSANGQLLYQPISRKTNGLIYNTMRTPRGGQYQLALEDGTHVWLNASSSLTFPIVFNGPDRLVKLEGEAFFAVSKNAKKPFRVLFNGTEIKVLGTEFNVNGYSDEPSIKTTLVKGSISVSKDSSSAILKPGQQAQITPGGKMAVIEPSDIDEIIAWKNGLFSFKDENIPSIMRQLARWYDLDVHFEGKISGRKFTGQIFRNLSLQEALKVLELSGVHFKTEGKKITVLP